MILMLVAGTALSWMTGRPTEHASGVDGVMTEPSSRVSVIVLMVYAPAESRYEFIAIDVSQYVSANASWIQDPSPPESHAVLTEPSTASAAGLKAPLSLWVPRPVASYTPVAEYVPDAVAVATSIAVGGGLGGSGGLGGGFGGGDGRGGGKGGAGGKFLQSGPDHPFVHVHKK